MIRMLFITVLSFIFCLYTFSQQITKPKELIEYHRKQMSLEFTFPQGFHEVDMRDSLAFAPRENTGFLNAISMHLKADKDDAVIALSLFDLDTTGVVGKPFIYYKDYNQLIGIRYFIGDPPTRQERDSSFRMDQDTAMVKYFDEAELKKYGATYGGIANVPMTWKYKGKFEKMKVLFFFKKGKGEVYQYYFYNQGAPIEKLIDRSRYIFRFKE